MSVRTWPMGFWLIFALVQVALVAFLTMLLSTLFIRSPDLPDRTRLMERLSADWPEWSDPHWQAEMSSEASSVGVEVRLTDRDDRMIVQMEPQQAPDRSVVDSLRHTKYNRRWVEVLEILNQGEPVGYAYLSYRWNPWLTDDRAVSWSGVVSMMALVIGSVLVGSLTAVWLLSRLILTPLRSLAVAAEQIGRGELAPPLLKSRVTEVAQVLTTFQRMAEGLRESVGRQAAMEEERRLFLSAISHDLRTPLFSLRGRLEGIRDGIARSPEQVAQYVGFGLKRVGEMERLVSDLFAYARLSILEQEPERVALSLDEFLREVRAKHLLAAEAKGIGLLMGSQPEPCTVDADPHLLGRAVDNLLENAIRHTPPSGTVEIGWRRERDTLLIWVADTGEGIAPELQAKLFTPLFRGETSRSRTTGGAGLGLVIAHRVAEAHGGELNAQNRAEGGACFTLTLPAV